jgi:hypothetical protein
MKSHIVSLNTLIGRIINTNGKIFRVTFIKRSTGELRDMTARFGVTDKLRGGELPFDPTEKKLLIVYDMEKEDYRAIPVDGLVSAHIDEVEYVCKDKIEELNRGKKTNNKRKRLT